MSPTHHTDILIIGAGPGGAMTALFLAMQGIPSLLVDKSSFPRDKVCGDALSGKVVEVLNRLDASLVKDFNEKSFQVDSWGVIFVAPNGKKLRIPFKSRNDRSGLPPGFISKRLDFDNYLIDLVRKNPLIELIEGVTLRDYVVAEDHVHVSSADKKLRIRAEMVIAADGSNSGFAKKVAKIKVRDKHQAYGLRAYYKGVAAMDHENFIELHFLHEIIPGYFWIFPLPGGMANVGLGLRGDILANRKINLKKKLQEIIATNPAIQNRLGHAELIGNVKLQSLPLGSMKRSISGNRFMLVGDAAALIDPFTGEGIGNAMLSGMLAANQARVCVQNRDFGSKAMSDYDKAVYERLWSELSLSSRLQQLANVPWLFNFVVNKASRSKTLSETISCMFEDMDLRARLKKPSFYFNLLFTNT